MNARIVLVKLCLALACICALSCAALPREQIRAALTLSAKGVILSNEICAQAGIALGPKAPAKALAMVRACGQVAKSSFSMLEAADTALDIGNEQSAFCAGNHALSALASMRDAIASAGVSVPKSIDDALAIARVLSGLASKDCVVTP